VLSGYGAPAGIVYDYGVTNPGKTTVTAVVADPDQAFCPDPANGADKVQSVISIVELCWEPGASLGDRGMHKIYFGDCPDPEYVGQTRAGEECWTVGNLPLWTTYCWRIDEWNQDGSMTPGKVWTFTTGCALIPGDTNLDCLVNFEDFACVAGTWMEEQMWP